MKDTLFDHTVLDPCQLLHPDVNEAGDESGQEADQTTDDPTAELQAAETLKTAEESAVGGEGLNHADRT